MEEHEGVLETDNTEAACGEKKHNVTSLAVPPCDIVSAGAPAVWRLLFRDAFPGMLRWEEGEVQGAGGPQTSELKPGASLSGRTVILIFVCASSTPYVTGEHAGISFKLLIARSNASTGGAEAIGPVDWAIFSDSSGAANRRIPSECAEKCGRSAAAAPKQEKPLNRRIQVAYYRTARP